jgi:hypothetical protein
MFTIMEVVPGIFLFLLLPVFLILSVQNWTVMVSQYWE